MFRANMNVKKITMFSKTAVDLKEDIYINKNKCIFIKFSAYWYNGKQKSSTTIQKHTYIRVKCPSEVKERGM